MSTEFHLDSVKEYKINVERIFLFFLEICYTKNGCNNNNFIDENKQKKYHKFVRFNTNKNSNEQHLK